MLLYIILAAVILIIFNLLLINRSERKKRFGIFPLYLSMFMTVLLILFTGTVRLATHPNSAPSMSDFEKGAHAKERFEEAMSQYEMAKQEDEDRQDSIGPYISIAFLVTRIQFCIAFVLGIFGLITVSGRSNYYYAIIFANGLGIVFTLWLSPGSI